MKFLKPVLYFKCKKFKIQNRFNYFIYSMIINTEKTKNELEEFIHDKLIHKQPIFVYFRHILSDHTRYVKKENILKIDPDLVDINSKDWFDEDYPIQSDVHFNQNFGNLDANHILDSLDKKTKDAVLENFKLDRNYINRSFINDNFFLNVLFDSEIEEYKKELYNEIISIKDKLNFLNY